VGRQIHVVDALHHDHGHDLLLVVVARGERVTVNRDLRLHLG
jgi:hypothetical protein